MCQVFFLDRLFQSAGKILPDPRDKRKRIPLHHLWERRQNRRRLKAEYTLKTNVLKPPDKALPIRRGLIFPGLCKGIRDLVEIRNAVVVMDM